MYTIYCDREGKLPLLRKGTYSPMSVPESHRQHWVEYSEQGKPFRWELTDSAKTKVWDNETKSYSAEGFHLWSYEEQRFVLCVQSNPLGTYKIGRPI